MDFATLTKQGEKEYNSDFIAAFEDNSSYCFAIADGRETPKAAELAVETVSEAFRESRAITKSSVSDFITDAGNRICEDELPHSACMAVMVTDGSVAVWGNVGDCRVYLLRDNFLYEITADHSDAYTLYEAGKIRYPKIRTNKNRYTLTRMLSRDYNMTPDSSQPEMIKKGDAFLVCTDGFWENIHERQVEKTLKKSKSAQDWLDRMMKIIEKNVHHKKYTRFRDSMSAIAIKL